MGPGGQWQTAIRSAAQGLRHPRRLQEGSDHPVVVAGEISFVVEPARKIAPERPQDLAEGAPVKLLVVDQDAVEIEQHGLDRPFSEADADRPRVGFEPFERGHQHSHPSQARQACLLDFLDGDDLEETQDGQASAVPRRPCGGKDVIGPRDIVPEGDGRTASDEQGAIVDQPWQQGAGGGDLDR